MVASSIGSPAALNSATKPESLRPVGGATVGAAVGAIVDSGTVGVTVAGDTSNVAGKLSVEVAAARADPVAVDTAGALVGVAGLLSHPARMTTKSADTRMAERSIMCPQKAVWPVGAPGGIRTPDP